MKLSQQLARAVRESGMSQAEICRAVGMSESSLSRFLSAEHGLSQAKLDALADLLRVDLVPRGAADRRRPARRRKHKGR